MNRWGAFVARRAGVVLAASLVLVALAAGWGIGVFGALSDGGFEDPASESSRVQAARDEAFAGSSDLVVVYSSTEQRVQDPAFADAVEETLGGLDPDAVTGAVTWFDTNSPELVSDDGRSTRVLLTLAGSGQEAKTASYDLVRDDLEAEGLQTHVAGAYVVFEDVNTQVGEDIARAESIAVPIVLLLSLVIFGSLVSALMPTLVGLVAVLGAFAVVRLITLVTDVSVFSINVITLLGMGLAIDYALFVVSRFREELAARPTIERADVAVAIARTMATAGRTVLFSGVIVASAMASLLIFPQNFLRSMGYGGMAAVLVAMVASLTLLPAVLTLLGRRLEWGTMPWRRRRGRSVTATVSESGVWARIAHSVMRRPVVYLVTIVAALLLVGSPILGATWGSVDERVLPADSPSRVAAEVVTDNFRGETSSADVILRDASPGVAEEYAADLRAVDGVRDVQVIDGATVDGVPTTLLQASWGGNAQTSASQDLVRDLRAVEPPDAATAQVGGTSAQTVDLVESVSDRLPWMAGVVAAVMLVLLFVAFGSVVLPVKAIVMNTVSIAASFGVVTWIFQDGNLSGLLGFTSPGYLDVTQPILMLAIIFGLSMDYEVFLLSRVREEWDRTGDNTAAVALGVQRTGRIITSAALLLAIVIGGFATSGIVFIKMIGVGMLVAVLLDATVVRALLVPATMRLLGAANWWAPGPLARWWERHGHREQVADEKIAAPHEPVPVG